MYGSILMLTISPDIVMGIAFLVVFIALHIELGFLTLLIAHTALCAPFVALTVLGRLDEFDEHLIEAARDLGPLKHRPCARCCCPLPHPPS